jgi:transcriptional regulator with XRE-family HTH domain
VTTQGQRIKDIAAEAGVSVSKLADMANIDRPALTKISNDKGGLGPRRAQRIADALGIDVSRVLLPRAKDAASRPSIDLRLRSLEAEADGAREVLRAVLAALAEHGIQVPLGQAAAGFLATPAHDGQVSRG